MKLYTGKGDKGTTTVFDSKPGERIPKDSNRIESLGSVDELNSYLGICKSLAKKTDHNFNVDNYNFVDLIHTVQESLFIIQAELAGADKKLNQDHLDWLEQQIKIMTDELSPITSFLIPGATEYSAYLDYSRALARKVERRIVEAQNNNDIAISEITMAYLNRLSSLLYVMVRFVNEKEEAEEKAPKYK